MEVSDTKALARVLDEMNISYKILTDTTADIYANLKISQLAAALAKYDCEIISMSWHDESLESYYISLVVGERDE